MFQTAENVQTSWFYKLQECSFTFDHANPATLLHHNEINDINYRGLSAENNQKLPMGIA